ncbi:MAG: response regulator [Chloroflexi bacterium]|nr:response regulator [Chloroflexota bacterium]
MNRSILIADDDPMIRRLIRIMLESADYTVIEAQDGQDALEKASAAHPDLIILNIMMPRMDGFTACEALRSRQETAHLPIVILTGQAHMMAVNKGLLAGANRYLTKPMTRNALLNNLRDILDPLPPNSFMPNQIKMRVKH